MCPGLGWLVSGLSDREGTAAGLTEWSNALLLQPLLVPLLCRESFVTLHHEMSRNVPSLLLQ